jgi:hypothetical protein
VCLTESLKRSGHWLRICGGGLASSSAVGVVVPAKLRIEERELEAGGLN